MACCTAHKACCASHSFCGASNKSCCEPHKACGDAHKPCGVPHMVEFLAGDLRIQGSSPYDPASHGVSAPGTHDCLHIYAYAYISSCMDLVRIHECLCERTRLRIVHLLLQGPLCVCHLQDVLREPQVKMSRHLAYLRRRGMVVRERCGQWMIYRLPDKPTPVLDANLACLQDCCREEGIFRRDALRLEKLKKELGDACPECVRTAPKRRGRAVPA